MVLFWVLPLNVLASEIAENKNTKKAQPEQRIGKLYNQNGYSPLVLEQEGKTFYSVNRKGLLLKYQMKPFKKLHTIDLKQLNLSYKQYGGASMHITNDGKRLVIFNYLNVSLIDLVNEKLIKTFSLNKQGYAAFLDKNRFVMMISKDSRKEGEIGKTEFKVLSTYDLGEVGSIAFIDPNIPPRAKLLGPNPSYQTLLINKSKQLAQVIVATNESVGPYYLIKGHKSRLVIFEKPSLKPIFIAQFKQIAGWYDPPTIRYSYDLKKIYLQEAEPFLGDEAFADSSYKTLNTRGNVEIDLDTLKVRKLKQPWHETEENTLRLYVRGGKSLATSQVGDFITFGDVLINTQEQYQSYLSMFEDGEAILFNMKTKKMIITEGARSHLKMQIDRQIRPMNEATFNHYIDAGNEL
ncbi:hypothetical protein [Thiomicrorhabdus hydrogeniphila]